MWLKRIKILILFLALGQFLILSNAQANEKYTASECFEGVSRATLKFNMTLDKTIFKPIAKGYRALPVPVRLGTSNAVENLRSLLTLSNNLLQGDWELAGNTAGRFAINSTLGILGFLDPAEKMGLKPHKEDVGQTLGSYGIGTGCYFVLPFLGPTTARDSIGLLADTFVDPFAHVTIRENELLSSSGSSLDYFSVKGTTAVDFRADNDKNLESLEKNSLDLYSSFKSVYLQDRENKIKNSTSDQDDWGNLDK